MIRTLSVRNPRTGQPDYSVDCADSEQVATTIKFLESHQAAWAQLSVDDRCAALLELAATLDRKAPDLTEALVRDTGRYNESLLEVQAVHGLIKGWAKQAPALLSEKPAYASTTRPVQIHSRWVPYSVVGAISPWNLPLLLSLIDAIPALAAGCAVLVKPSEVTPRFITPLREAIGQVESVRSVLAFVTGDGETGRAICEQADMLCFTGSLATGREVSKVAGNRMVPASLELGGKDAALVFEGAELERAAKSICWGGFTNAGQACQAIERVYVQRSVYDRFLSLLVDVAGRLTINRKDVKSGDIGPVIDKRQVAVIRQQLADAKAQGAYCLLGGELVEAGGFWCPPTVLTAVHQRMAVMQEETFATILPVMPFDTDDEAVRLANDSRFGLSAAVFSRNQTQALHIARQLQAGAVSINDCSLTTQVFDAEKNSFKQSGLGGSRMGLNAIRRFLRAQALLENPDGQPSPWWYSSLQN